MKKILLATSALIASATIANAQAVTISGEGRMGLQYMDDMGVSEWRQESRLQLDFNVAVEADHGLTFGAWTRARMETGGLLALTNWGYGVGAFSSARVWVESNGLRLTFGNTDGALVMAGTSHGWLGGCGVGYEGGILCADSAGLDFFAHQEDASYSGGSIVHATSRVLLTYEMGDTVVAISHDRGFDTEFGARTSFGAITVAAGYTTAADVWTISGHYDGGAWGVGAIVAGNSGFTNWSLSGNVMLGGGNLYGFVGERFDDEVFGLSYSYGLGGGSNFVVGAERVGGTTDLTVASVGVVFSF